MDIRKKIVEGLNKKDRIIEFGPLNRPTVTKDEFPNTYYADVRSTEEVKKLYTDNIYLKKTGIKVDINTIVDIDYVISKSYKETFKNVEKFDVAILSHVIEHMPDIIYFFQDIKNILKPNGKLIIIYPDKRYCFDHYRTEISFRDAYWTYKYGQSNNEKIIFDFNINVMKENDASFFWSSSNIISKINHTDTNKITNDYYKIKNNRNTEDVHFWPVYDYSFIKLVYDMRNFHLFDFCLLDFIPTQPDTQEFMATFKYTNNLKEDLVNHYLKELDPNVIYSKQKRRIEELEIQVNENVKIKEELRELKEKNQKYLDELKYYQNSRVMKVRNYFFKIFKPFKKLVRK